MDDTIANKKTSPPPPPPPTTTEEGNEEASPDKDCSKKLKLNNGGDEDSKKPDESSNGSSVAATPPDKDNNVPPPPPLTTPEEEPPIQIQVMFNKNPIMLEISPSMTVLKLKEMIKAHTGVDPHLQKVLLKGIAKDEAVLRDLGVGPGTKKILVIGSSIEDVLKVKEVPDTSGGGSRGAGSAASDSAGSNWCSVQVHKKVVDKGLPDDAMPGILDEHDPLPPFPLHGMYSSKGSKVRLTFKLESDELWIGTKERTEKVPIGTIRNVISQPITGYEHYHIVAIQLGPTEASRFFVYWVPAQYVEAIKDALTGA